MPILKYVGLLKRFAALFIDGIILNIINYILFAFGHSNEPTLQLFVGYLLLAPLISWGYYALFESSPAQGTPGKIALGIAVTNQSGEQISLVQGTMRVVGKFLWALIFLIAFAIAVIAGKDGNSKSPLMALAGLLMIASLLLLLVGYIMAAFTPEKQALHDRMARTVVIECEDESRQFPQKVLLQIAALAIVSRLIFQLVPATSIPGMPSSSTPTPPPTETPSPSPTETPIETPTPTPTPESDENRQTIKVCGEVVTLRNSNQTVDKTWEGKWEFQFSAGNIKHIARLIIKGNSGTMLTAFREADREVIVEQNIRLGTSQRGTWIVGFDPVDPDTKEKKTYNADNFFIDINPDGSLTGHNCDDGGNLVPISIQKFGE